MKRETQNEQDGETPDDNGSNELLCVLRRLTQTATARFTERQGQYLAFIHAYTKLNGRPPAQADIQRYFKVTPPSVHQMVLTLERRWLLRRTPRQARSLEVLVAPEELPDLR